MSLSEVIDLSLSQVDSMVQGRRIAVAQEESAHLRNALHQRVEKYEPIATKSPQPVVVNSGNDVAQAKDELNNYDTSFDSISTDTNIKQVESCKNSSISDEYSIEQTKSLKIGCFSQPLMSESAKFRVLSLSDLMKKSIKEILDYKEQVLPLGLNLGKTIFSARVCVVEYEGASYRFSICKRTILLST